MDYIKSLFIENIYKYLIGQKRKSIKTKNYQNLSKFKIYQNLSNFIKKNLSKKIFDLSKFFDTF